jgi:hypothetical protein
MNKRIQLGRTRGWRKPDSVIVVTRPGRWGNPFLVGVHGDRVACVQRYRQALTEGELPYSVGDVRRELGGHDLACWCQLSEPCHADILLEMALGVESGQGAAPSS